VWNLLDDDKVADSDLVYRRASWTKIGGRSKTPTGQVAKISANFFSDYPEAVAKEHGYDGPCMSIGLHSVLVSCGFEPSAMLEKFPEFGLLVASVGDLRRLKKHDGESCPQGVLASRTDEEPWHGVVFDMADRPRRDPTRKAIAKVFSWEIPLVG
jgi:hypothetical protein